VDLTLKISPRLLIWTQKREPSGEVENTWQKSRDQRTANWQKDVVLNGKSLS
jgi:hypothetical protein